MMSLPITGACSNIEHANRTQHSFPQEGTCSICFDQWTSSEEGAYSKEDPSSIWTHFAPNEWSTNKTTHFFHKDCFTDSLYRDQESKCPTCQCDLDSKSISEFIENRSLLEKVRDFFFNFSRRRDERESFRLEQTNLPQTTLAHFPRPSKKEKVILHSTCSALLSLSMVIGYTAAKTASEHIVNKVSLGGALSLSSLALVATVLSVAYAAKKVLGNNWGSYAQRVVLSSASVSLVAGKEWGTFAGSFAGLFLPTSFFSKVMKFFEVDHVHEEKNISVGFSMSTAYLLPISLYMKTGLTTAFVVCPLFAGFLTALSTWWTLEKLPHTRSESGVDRLFNFLCPKAEKKEEKAPHSE